MWKLWTYCGHLMELSIGGQWRVPISEIRRLQSEGVPAAPTFIEDDPEPPAPAPRPAANRLLASPSPEMVYAAEDAEIEEVAVRKEEATVRLKENTVRKLRLELEEQEQMPLGRYVDDAIVLRRNATLDLSWTSSEENAARPAEHAAFVSATGAVISLTHARRMLAASFTAFSDRNRNSSVASRNARPWPREPSDAHLSHEVLMS